MTDRDLEALEAWEFEVARISSPRLRDVLLAAVMVVGVGALIGVMWGAVLAFEGGSGAATWFVVLSVLIAGAMVFALRSVRRASRRRVVAEMASIRRRRTVLYCPCCGREAGAQRCGGCDAPLAEGQGLVVVDLADAERRRERWRAAARHQLRHVRPTFALAPPVWLGLIVLSIVSVVSLASVLGGAVHASASTEASLGEPREIPDDGVARARGGSELGSGVVGEATRPLAPLRVGTDVLAAMGRGPYHAFAVIVRVREASAFVVYADGDSAWVERGALRVPEIAAADAVEMFDGAGFVPGIVRARLGPALLVDGAWSSVSRMRVRRDAAHVEGEGRASPVPPAAWVEARVDAEWRAGIAVDSIEQRQRIVLGRGSERWFEPSSVRAQRLGPGARVQVDGHDRHQIIAARIGHAFAIVGPDGERGWTALARISRR